MFCIDCGHPLVYDFEKALSGERQTVVRSTLTQNWICDLTGNEHRRGDAHDFVNRVRTTLPKVFEMVEDDILTAEQALQVIKMDLGFMDRTEGAKKITSILKTIDKNDLPPEMLATYLDREIQ